MAINLVGSTNSRSDYGDLSFLDAATALTVAFRIKFTAAPSDNRYCSKWGGPGGNTFIIQGQDTNEVGFALSGNSGIFGRKTDTANLANGSQYGVVCTWASGTPNVVHIVINGSDESVSEFVDNSNQATLDASNAVVSVGHEPGSSTDGNDGDYSDFAIWLRTLTVAEAQGISNGMSPALYPNGLALYDRMINTSQAKDEIGGVVPSITAGINASHPAIIYPSAQILQFPPAAAASAADLTRFLSLLGVG